MPVIVHLPTPHPDQKACMTALGFEQIEAEGDCCTWRFSAFGDTYIQGLNLEIQLRPEAHMNLPGAVAHIIRTAKQAGDSARIAKIQEALTPSNR